MPIMRNKFKTELKRAFDKDHATALSERKTLASGSKATHHSLMVKRALTYRSQVEAHIEQMISEKKTDEEIEYYLKAARKIFRGFLGLK